MSKNNQSPFRGFFIITAIILFIWIIVLLVDQVFNGVFKEWFYTLFFIEPDFSAQGKIGAIFKSWQEIKQFFLYVFIIFIVICIVISYTYERYRNKQEITFITDTIKTFMISDNDEIALPKKYSEIEAQLVKLKSVTQKQHHIMEMESQQKNDLITYLAHDLKTPLASVIGYLSLLHEASDMPSVQKSKYTEIALEKSYRLEELINEFFEITRFNLQSIVLNKTKIRLSYMIMQLADEFYPMLAPDNKNINIDVPNDLVLIGDADKLARVFNNILKNAVVYSSENSLIEIHAVQSDNTVMITFTNQGTPIPAQKLNTIFEKFYRLDSARSTDTGGAGLGLAIAKEIVTAHGGQIYVESSLENTTFTVSLPLI